MNPLKTLLFHQVKIIPEVRELAVELRTVTITWTKVTQSAFSWSLISQQRESVHTASAAWNRGLKCQRRRTGGSISCIEGGEGSKGTGDRTVLLVDAWDPAVSLEEPPGAWWIVGWVGDIKDVFYCSFVVNIQDFCSRVVKNRGLQSLILTVNQLRLTFRVEIGQTGHESRSIPQISTRTLSTHGWNEVSTLSLQTHRQQLSSITPKPHRR